MRSGSLAGQHQRFTQYGDVADMVGQQQNQTGVERLALFVAEVAMRVDERFVEVIARRKVAKVALAGFIQVGLQLQRHGGVPRVQALQVARPRAMRTWAASSVRQRAATCWSGRSR